MCCRVRRGMRVGSFCRGRTSQGSPRRHNVVLHEFAHYLDLEDETMDGAPGLGSAAEYAEWSGFSRRNIDRLEDDVDAGRETLLDPYAASEPAEFFAVATETFFEQAAELKQRHAGLYGSCGDTIGSIRPAGPTSRRSTALASGRLPLSPRPKRCERPHATRPRCRAIPAWTEAARADTNNMQPRR